MLIETLRPDAQGDECNIPREAGAACPNHYQNVDEEVSDEYTTRVFSETDVDYDRDLYNVENHSVGSGTINFIKVYAHVGTNTTPDQNSLKICMKTGGTAYEGPEITIVNGWLLCSKQWDTNPQAERAWSWEDIDALQIGVSVRSAKPGPPQYDTHVSQVYVEVDYTPPQKEGFGAADRMVMLIKAGVL